MKYLFTIHTVCASIFSRTELTVPRTLPDRAIPVHQKKSSCRQKIFDLPKLKFDMVCEIVRFEKKTHGFSVVHILRVHDMAYQYFTSLL
jgi:hypothetical protein